MKTPQPVTELEVRVSTRSKLSTLLAESEATLIAASPATGPRTGILITRHSSRHYTVALSTTVPFGETHELSE